MGKKIFDMATKSLTIHRINLNEFYYVIYFSVFISEVNRILNMNKNLDKKELYLNIKKEFLYWYLLHFVFEELTT